VRGARGTLTDLLIRNPTIVLGIGGAGSRIIKQVQGTLEGNCVVVSNDKKDLAGIDNAMLVDSRGWVNPSSHKLRSFAEAMSDEIGTALKGFSTVIIVSNMGGRAGTAMSPIISKIAKNQGVVVIAVAIMPFKFEKDRLFSAGITFRRLKETCDSVIVMDNDAFLENNPELTRTECHTLTNRAITEVLGSLSANSVRRDVNVLCTSKSGANSEASLRDSVAMLYRDVPDPGSIQRTMLYVMGGEKLPVGELNKMIGYMNGMFKLDSSTEVAMTTSTSENVSVHLLASSQQKTRFDSYDPLGEIFAKKDMLDWDEPESSPDITLSIPVIE
jgi:cell division protein FtsZ